jgi:hypothetical protein
MRRRFLFLGPAVALLILTASPGSGMAAANSRVTVDNDATSSYTRYDGSSDAVTRRCSHDRRQQNEPSVAVDPHDTDVVVAGANDYCTVPNTGDVWSGYYRSTDGGTTWQDSLVPGYPGDTSPKGSISPVNGTCSAAGDPSQDFDRAGRLFYAYICFNRGKPVNGGIYVSRYLHDGADYDRTVLVKKGQPSAIFAGSGHFQDKDNITVDQSASSPFRGNVYVGWSQYNGQSGNNNVLVSRSTNHGVTFQKPVKVTPTEPGTASFVDVNVGPDGALYVNWIRYTSSFTGAVMLARSTDGGQRFGRARRLASIDLFDSNQFSGNGAYECGDAPVAECPSGFTYSRFFSNSAVEADGTGVHVVWASDDNGGQSQVYVRNSSDGVHFTPAARIDPQARGHQWFPDVSSADGTINVIYYDSREDPAYSPSNPPGNTSTGHNSGDVVNTFLAQSTDGGATWSSTQVSNHGSNFGWETHGGRTVGFWGDYLYVSAVPGAVNLTWTDSRDLVPGEDPRESGDSDDDGFDVLQTPCPPNPSSADTCLDTGGLDQNIYGARA